MSHDSIVRTLLGVIAAALVYLCIVLTPVPVVHGQAAPVFGTRSPGEQTGPAEVVIVGWRVADTPAMPVQVVNRVVADVRVVGPVETRQVPRTTTRVVLAGWEPNGPPPNDTYTRWDTAGRGLPVSVVSPPRP